MTSIFNFLDQRDISYVVLDAICDKQRHPDKKEEFKKDLDIVLDCNRAHVIDLLHANNNFTYLENNSFFDIENNLRIDLYFRTLNVGYYHFLEIQKTAYSNKYISESEYIIYQLIDPLLKFARYRSRHKYRLNKYFSSGISKDVESLLTNIMGRMLANHLLKKVSRGDFNISISFIKMCKLSILLINGNFVRMLKNRLRE